MSGPRDGEAESYIRQKVTSHSAAPYYMAQAIIVQEQALNAANARIQELEQEVSRRPAAGGGGFLSGLFGGGSPAPTSGRRSDSPASAVDPRVAAYADPRRGRAGGGFLAGAAQTAMGVAGGLVLGNLLADVLFPNEASADEHIPAEEDRHPEEDPDAGTDDSFFGEEL